MIMAYLKVLVLFSACVTDLNAALIRGATSRNLDPCYSANSDSRGERGGTNGECRPMRFTSVQLVTMMEKPTESTISPDTPQLQPSPRPSTGPTPQPSPRPSPQPSPRPSPSPTRQEERTEVLVIGGGWSGVSALEELDGLGITDTILLEARNYLGGRSRTVVGAFGSPTLAIELGSAWVYEDTEIQTLVDSVGVNYGVINYSGDWTYLALYADLRGDFNTDDDFVPWQDNISSGRLSSREEDYLLNVEWEDYFVPFSREQTRLLRNSGVDEPYQQVLTDYFNFWDMPEGNRHRQFINAMVATQISVEYNAPLSQLSTQTVGTSVNSCIFCGSDHYMAVENGGFSRLIEAISEPVRDRVRLESRVTQVDYSDANGPIRVAYRNADGEERVVLANRVLVTVPVGVLKAQTIQFIPDLPSWKRSAIRYMGFGVLNKCILYWDFDAEPTWWPTDKAVLSLITDDDETSGVWTTFFNDRELDNGGHFILSAWIGGDNAIWSEKNQSDKEVVDNVIANLRSMLGRNVPYPDDYIVTRWGQDEFARGSYSFVPVGTADIDDVREDLASPVRGRLFFAGEATDSFYGTVVGARRSGIRSARDIRNSL